MDGDEGNYWAPDYSTGSWKLTKEVVQPLIKVETHNHPTAISPFPGAATGSGGEIRDEGAVGRGSSPKAGLCGFWVSDLLIPGKKQPWEVDIGRPAHYASSLDIMLEAPIGSARFNNEFGRPALTGTFRTLLTNEADSEAPEYRGYHKPIMVSLRKYCFIKAFWGKFADEYRRLLVVLEVFDLNTPSRRTPMSKMELT